MRIVSGGTRGALTLTADRNNRRTDGADRPFDRVSGCHHEKGDILNPVLPWIFILSPHIRCDVPRLTIQTHQPLYMRHAVSSVHGEIPEYRTFLTPSDGRVFHPYQGLQYPLIFFVHTVLPADDGVPSPLRRSTGSSTDSADCPFDRVRVFGILVSMQESGQQHGVTVLFLYIGNAIAALVSVISGFMTVFAVIDYFLMPDTLMWWDYNAIVTGGQLAGSVSFLIISFIALVFLARTIRKKYAVRDLRGSAWHNWCRVIVMVVLALAILTILIAVAMLLEGFLSGDIHLAQTLKLVFTLGIGLMVFCYYRGVLRGIWRENRMQEMVFTYTVIGLVVLLAVVSVAVIRPFEVRNVKETNATLRYIERADGMVNDFYRTKKYIPAALDEIEGLADEKGWEYPHGIYGTAKPVTYERTGRTAFTLCAVFNALPRGTEVSDYRYAEYEVASVGKNCFDLDVGD